MGSTQWQTWLLAARPKTLWAGTAPVIMGAAMAAEAGRLHVPSALCALLGSVLIQIGTNFANDYFDHAKGADTGARIGPLRVTQAGLVTPAAMRWAVVITFLLACVPGLYLVWRGGWVLVAIGLVSILCGVLYTAGPYPLGYLGLGDLFVLIFFGPVAVGGTYFVQALTVNTDVLLAGLAAGLFSVAILAVNNLRDIEQDRAAGKKTLAVRLGRTFARCEYAGCLAVGGLAIPLFLGLRSGHLLVWMSSLALLVAAPTVRVVFTRLDGVSLNDALAATGRVLLVFSLLFSITWLL